MNRGGFLPVIQKHPEARIFRFLGLVAVVSFLGVQARVHSSIEHTHGSNRAGPSKKQTAIPAPEWGGMSGWDSTIRRDSPTALEQTDHLQALSLLPPEFKLNLVDRNGGLMLQQAYSDMNRGYELKEKFGLLDNYSRQEHTKQLQDLSQSVWSDLRNRQVEQARGMVIKSPFAASATKAARYIPKPIAILLFAAHAIYFGNVLNWDVGPARFSTMADVQQRKSIIGLSHPLVNTSVRFQALNPNTLDPATGQTTPNNGLYTFQYELSLGHTIPDLGLTTGFSYINTSDAFSAQVSQPLLVPNLTATLSAVTPIPRGNGPTLIQPNQSIRLDYGIRF